ncbi:hypothetical protein YN1HA_6590 [Sulfurisphaera ohwakuensis]
MPLADLSLQPWEVIIAMSPEVLIIRFLLLEVVNIYNDNEAEPPGDTGGMRWRMYIQLLNPHFDTLLTLFF